MTEGHDDDEAPPPPPGARTPAELAGATPLDAERFRAHAGMPKLQREREIVGQVSPEDPVEPVVRRRHRTGPQRSGSSSRGWFRAAAALGLVGVVALLVGWWSDGSVQVASAEPPAMAATTPVLAARRVPELVARPVATRNLRAAAQPVLDRLPAGSCVQVRDGGNDLLAVAATEPVIPASNLKLLTSAAALDLLGPQTRLATRVATDGAPTDGKVVRGNLYLIGGGDPLLSTPGYLAQLPHGEQPSTDMEALADQIAATGIRQVTGSVVGDESHYDDVRVAGNWPDRYLTQGQVAPLSALVVNDAWTSGAGPAGQPAVHAAGVLTALLRARGVQIGGAPTSGVAPADAAPLTEVPSRTVAELVDEGLRFSDNTTVELLVKEIGLRAAGEGTTTAGLAAIRTWLSSSGLPEDGVEMADGSGLSEEDRLTCTLVTAVLEEDGADGVLAAGLARPGEPGTLDDRLLESDLRDRVAGKTGTLRTSTALSGWLRTRTERDLAFAIIINRRGGQVTPADTALQGQLLRSMLDHPQTPDLAQLGPAPAAPPGG